MQAAVAAGHPATTAAGVEVLEQGGSAADAAVAAVLASCVAETVMTGLLGGGHAIYFEAASGTARSLDCFVAIPGLGAEPREAELIQLAVPFGAELVHYAVGPASCAVPGLPAGLDALWQEYGRLPWPVLAGPAISLAREGVVVPPAHASCLAMLAPVMTMNEGAAIYAPGGQLLQAGDRLHQPGLVDALESIAEEASPVYTGTIADDLLTLCEERGGLVTRTDLAAYEARWTEPVQVPYLDGRLLTRGGLSGVPETVRCVFTTSLGLGSGDFLPGLYLHLNSMLGEVDLLRGRLEPGDRMQSMMAPTIVVDHHGLSLAAGAAGGTRLKTALLTVVAGILDELLLPETAVARPRFHAAPDVVNVEPGVDEGALEALEAGGRKVRRWPERHHYFGGVSVVSRTGAAGDPRRNGAAATIR